MSVLDDSFSSVTPLQSLGSLDGANEVWVKRDDLIPFCFGGNKARIAASFVRDARAKGKTCLVGYGSTRSNLSRALACACSSEGMRCIVIVPSEADGLRSESSNSRLVALLGAETVFCDKSGVRNAVRATLDRLISEGESPYYVYGDETGKGNEAVAAGAYAGFWDEVAAQSPGPFDELYLACGTGMTMGGIVADALNSGNGCRVTGISVARESNVAEGHVRAYIEAATSALQARRGIFDWRILDSFLHGGYGMADEVEMGTVRSVFRSHGLPMDFTYVGKAFDGMLRTLAREGASGKRVLFLHTGGAPLFIDDMNSLKR